MENVVRLSVQTVNLYLLDCAGGKLLIEAGWAGSLAGFKNELKRYKIATEEIRYVMFTHHHPDHAGLTQEIKNASGARLLIHEKQAPLLKDLRAFYERKRMPFVPVEVGLEDVVVKSENRATLHGLGIPGEMIETPGHSADSVSFLSDGGLAFVGDLPPPGYVPEEAEEAVRQSWLRLIEKGARVIYPAHVESFPVERIQALL